MSSKANEHSAKGKNITDSIIFTNTTKNTEYPKKDKQGTYRGKNDGVAPENGTDRQRTAPNPAGRPVRGENRQFPNRPMGQPGMGFPGEASSPHTMDKPSVTSFSNVHQPAYRKQEGFSNHMPPHMHGEGEFMPSPGFGGGHMNPQQLPLNAQQRGFPRAPLNGAVQPGQPPNAAASPRTSPISEDKDGRRAFERQQMHGHFMPNMHPMHPPMMYDPFSGYMQYPVPPARAMPSPPAQAPKFTVVIQDDSGKAMNLSTWKAQKSEDGEEKGESVLAETTTAKPEKAEAEASETSSEANGQSLEAQDAVLISASESEPPTPVDSKSESAEEAKLETPIVEAAANLTYSLMLSYRTGRVDNKLVSKEILSARKEIETRNDNENKDSNPLRYFQTNVETRQSMFGTNVTEVHQTRSNFANQAENPFTAGHGASLEHVEKMKKLLQGALNKITSTNYEKLSGVVLEIDFPGICEDLEVMNDLIGMFFDKAINEPAWARVYASLCKDIREKYGTEKVVTDAKEEDNTEQENGEVVASTRFGKAFRRGLLAYCQKEFNVGQRLQAEIESVASDDKDRKLLKLRKQTFNNMKFIGELYKEKLITKRVMHTAIYSVLFENPITDESLEMCCELLTNIGLTLEEHTTTGSVSYMDIYFKKLHHLATQYPTARVRFKIQNLIDLRASKWDTTLPVPETPLELKRGRAKPFPDNRSSPSPMAPPQAQIKKVMNRHAPQVSFSGLKTAHHASVRATDSARPITPVTPMTPQGTSTRKKWREVIPVLIKEQLETIVETLHGYTMDARRDFLEELFNYLLGVRLHTERSALREMLPEFIEKNILNKRDIDRTCTRCVRMWVDEETIMDHPRLWESWTEIMCACLESESVSSAECLGIALKMLIEKEDAESISIFIAQVNTKLRGHDALGVLPQTLDLLSRPKLLEEVMQSEKASSSSFDTTLAEYYELVNGEISPLQKNVSLLDVKRRLYVVTTYLAVRFEDAGVAQAVVPHLENALALLLANGEEIERTLNKEFRGAYHFLEDQSKKECFMNFVEDKKLLVGTK